MDGTNTEKLTREERDRLVQKTALSNRNARAALAKILGKKTTDPSSPLSPSTRDRLLTETQGKLAEVRDIFKSLKAGKREEGVPTPEDEFDQALRKIGNPRTQTRRESPSSEQEEWAEAFDAFVPGAGQGPKPAHEEKSEFDKAADEALRATGDDLVPGPVKGVPEEDPLFESQDPRVEDPFGEGLTHPDIAAAERKIARIHNEDARGAPKTKFEGVVNWGTADGNALAARAQSFDEALSKESGAEQEEAAREDVSMAQNLSRETIEKESQRRRREKMARGVSVYIRRSSGDLQEGKYVPEEGRVYFLDNPKDETSFVGYYENVTNEQLVPLNPHLAYTSKEGVALSGAADKLGQEVGDPNTWLEFERGVAEAKAKAYRDQEIDPAGFRHLQKNDAEVRDIARVGLSQGAKIGALVPETKKSVPRIDTHEKDRETNSLNGLNAFNSKIASQKGLPSPAKSIAIQREKSAVESRGGLETILVGQELSVSDHGEAVPVIVRGISGDQVLVEIKRSGDLMYVSRNGLGEKIPPSKDMVSYKEKPLEEVRASSHKRDAGYTVWEQGERCKVPDEPLSLSQQKKLSGPAQAPGFPFSKLPTVPDMPLGKHPEAERRIEEQKQEEGVLPTVTSLGKPYKKIDRDGLEDFDFEEVPGTKPAIEKRESAGQEQKKTTGPLETKYTLEEYREALNIFDTILPKIPKENSLTLMNTKDPVGKIAPETPPKPEGKGRVTQVPEVLIEEARQATKGFDGKKIKGMIKFREKNSSSKDLRNEASALRAILNEPKQTDSTVREKAVSSSSADKLLKTLATTTPDVAAENLDQDNIDFSISDADKEAVANWRASLPKTDAVQDIEPTPQPQTPQFQNFQPLQIPDVRVTYDFDGYQVVKQKQPASATQPPQTSSLDQTPQRDFDAEKSVFEEKIEAQAVIIDVLKKRLASMEALEKAISGAVSSGKLLSDPEQEETLKPTRAAKKVTEDLLAKEESKLALMQGELTKLTQEEVAASKQLSTQTQQQNLQAAPTVNQVPVELDRILSPFEKELGSQTTLAGLAELLISKEYKDKVFGTGTRKVTGKEIAKRISEKVLQAPKDAQIDPSFFIPDTTIAQKVFELIQEDTSWQKGVSSYGTPLIEKIDTPVQDEATKKALEATTKKIQEATNPTWWTRAKAWMGNKKTLGAGLGIGIGAVALEAQKPVLASLFALLFSGEVQAKEIPTQPAMSSDTVETVVTLPETEAQKSTSEAESAGDETGAQEGLAVDPFPTPDTESRPKDYTRSLGKYVNYLNSVGRLDEFARVLTFGEKDPEKTTDGTVNTRSFWWETMLLQPAENIIPNANKSGRPDLTIKYRDFVRSQAGNIAEYPNLDDNSFHASNNLYKKFDTWYKNDVVSTIQALESELTPEERGYLDLGKNKKITLGEYLAEVVRLSRKYDVRDVGLRTLSKEEEGKVVASLLAAPQGESTPSAEAAPAQEGGDIFSLSYEQAGNAWWAIQALEYATNTPVSDQESLRSWFNGPYYQMVNEWREQKSIGTTYTTNELLILQDAFQRLSDNISNKTEAGKNNGLMFSNLGTNGQNEQREVGKILEEIKRLLETLK